MRRQWGGRRLAFVAASWALVVCPPGQSADGQLEINQACVADGCFPGDTAGFPVQITSSGSYVLASNLFLSGESTAAIEINAALVTLDLGGFTLFGSATSSPGAIAINQINIEVRNGSIASFAKAGITATNRANLKLRDLKIHTIFGGPGIELDGGLNIEIANSFVGVATGGIVGSAGRMTIVGCRVSDTLGGGDGITTGPRALVEGNTVSSNQGDGIEVGEGSIVRGNVVTDNGAAGIRVFGSTLVIGNVAMGNDTLGGGQPNITACPTCTFVDNEAP